MARAESGSQGKARPPRKPKKRRFDPGRLSLCVEYAAQRKRKAVFHSDVACFKKKYTLSMYVFLSYTGAAPGGIRWSYS